MPYYKDAQPMYAQQNPQPRVTPLSQEMYAPSYRTAQDDSNSNSVKDFFTKYWWVVALVLIVLVFIIYLWYHNKNNYGEKIVEF